MWPLVRSNGVIVMMMIMIISLRAGVQSESALGTVERRNTLIWEVTAGDYVKCDLSSSCLNS
jgi:hypothetical protein